MRRCWLAGVDADALELERVPVVTGSSADSRAAGGGGSRVVARGSNRGRCAVSVVSMDDAASPGPGSI